MDACPRGLCHALDGDTRRCFRGRGHSSSIHRSPGRRVTEFEVRAEGLGGLLCEVARQHSDYRCEMHGGRLVLRAGGGEFDTVVSGVQGHSAYFDVPAAGASPRMVRIAQLP